MSLAAYGRLLGAPYIGALVGSALLARLPAGFEALAVLLLVSESTGSFAAAGGVAALVAASAGVAAPLLGRLVDRLGQTRVLVPLGVAQSASAGGFAIAGHLGAPIVVLVVIAPLLGATTPPISACLRALWSDTLPSGVPAHTAYSLESTAQEVVFIVGPLIAALILTVAGPAAVLASAAVLVLVGTIAFAAQPPSRRWRSRGPRPGRRDVLARPGIRTLLAAAAVLVASFAAVEVSVTALATERGAREAAGVILAIWAAASLLGGVWHGARAWRGPVRKRIQWMSVLGALGFVPLVAAWSVTSAALLIVAAGVFIAPVLACVMALVADLAPEGGVTEAFSWLNSAFIGGGAIGAAVGGISVDELGVRGALVIVVALAALCPLVIISRRRTLAT